MDHLQVITVYSAEWTWLRVVLIGLLQLFFFVFFLDFAFAKLTIQ